jgi:hypothetical protein
VVRAEAGDQEGTSRLKGTHVQQSLWKPVVVATVISGTLDILFAMGLTLILGREVPNMLRYVASGPFPAAVDMGEGGAILGVVVHFALMAVIVAGFVLLASRRSSILHRPLVAGVVFGLVTYVAMNLVVVPLRFGTPLPPKPLSIGTQLFAHVVLVGIPTALIACRYLRVRESSCE